MITRRIYDLIAVNDKIPAKRCSYDFLKRVLPSDYHPIVEYHETLVTCREFLFLCRENKVYTDLEKCSVCKLAVQRIRCSRDDPFSPYCSSYCANRDIERCKEQAARAKNTPEKRTNSLEKRKRTMLEKYGVEYNSQREDIKHIYKKPKSDYRLVSDYDWFYEQYVVQQKTYTELSAEFDIPIWQFTKWSRIHNIDPIYGRCISAGQKQIAEWIQSLGFKVILNDRDKLDGKEIDILVPDANFGIEYDGLYYHSSTEELDETDKNYHRMKVDLAKTVGINLIRVLDYEWLNKTDLIKSMIKSRLGISDHKIHARKCRLEEIDSATARKFLSQNHINGFSGAKFHQGLFYNNELVSVLSIGESRFNKQCVWEIIRFASKMNCNIVGGFQKMLSYFRKTHPGSIHTYADKRLGTVMSTSGLDSVS